MITVQKWNFVEFIDSEDYYFNILVLYICPGGDALEEANFQHKSHIKVTYFKLCSFNCSICCFGFLQTCR